MRVILGVAKYEIKYQFKNIVFWIGMILLAILINQEVLPYVQNYPINNEMNLSNLNEIGSALDLAVELKPEEVKNQRELILINNKYYRHGTLNEAQSNFADALSKERFSEYFGRRLNDRLGVFSSLILVFIFAFIFEREKRHGMNEILHTQSFKPSQYGLGKYIGALIAYLTVITFCFVGVSTYLYMKFEPLGYQIHFLDLLLPYLSWVVISILFGSLFSVVVSLIFRNGLAAIPIYLILFIHSVTAVYTNGTSLNFIVNWSRFLIRSDGGFFDMTSTEMMDGIYVNRLLYLLLSLFLAVTMIPLWNRYRSFKMGVFYDRLFRFSKHN